MNPIIPSYSIAIQTYVYRYDSYLKPLIANIHQQRPDKEKIVFINGQHKESFDQNYRKNILGYLASFPNTYPVMSPFMRGCAFMWNQSINFTSSSSDYILVLSDDTVFKEGFFDDFESMLRYSRNQGDESFRINSHWGHFCMYRKDLLENVGFFDERLIGFGQEDGDWMWRFHNKFGKPMRNFLTQNLFFVCDGEHSPGKNTNTVPGTKFSVYNRNFMYQEKMKPDPGGTCTSGFPTPPDGVVQRVVKGMETPDMYPGERWYRSNIHKL